MATSNPVDALAAAIRAKWGGNWDIGGADRARQLAEQMVGAGITDLNSLQLADREFDVQESGRWVDVPDRGRMWETYEGSGDNSSSVYREAPNVSRVSGVTLRAGDREIGTLNRPGWAVGMPDNWIDQTEAPGWNGPTAVLGWGDNAKVDGKDGQVVFTLKRDPKTGQTVVAPEFAASRTQGSTFGEMLKAGALIVGGAYGLSSAFGPAAVGGSAAGGAGFVGEGVASGIGAWDAAATSAGLNLGSGAATVAGAGGALEGGSAVNTLVGGGSAGGSGATNAALIESATGTAGYGASSAGLGGAEAAAWTVPAGTSGSTGAGTMFDSMWDKFVEGATGSAGKAIGNAVVGGIVGKVLGPDAPDMSGVNRAADKGVEIADRQISLAERQYADSLKLFEEFKPQFKQAIDTYLAEQGKSIQRADAAWADYENTWRPIEQKLASTIQNFDTPQRRESEAQRAGLGVASSFDTARTAAEREMVAAGLDPSTIAKLNASSRIDEAKATAGAANEARRNVEMQGIQLLEGGARFGRNQPSTGITLANTATNQGQAVQTGVQNLQSSQAAPAQTAGSLYSGAASTNQGAGGLYGQLANMQFGFNNAQSKNIMDGIGAGLWAAGRWGG